MAYDLDRYGMEINCFYKYTTNLGDKAVGIFVAEDQGDNPTEMALITCYKTTAGALACGRIYAESVLNGDKPQRLCTLEEVLNQMYERVYGDE